MSDEISDKAVLVMARLIDQIADRQARASLHGTESRDTYSDGFASGLSEALHLVSSGIRADVKDFDERLMVLKI